MSSHSSHSSHSSLLSLSDETDILNTINGCNANVMVIMRGLPGCGKTTLANKLLDKCHSGAVVSTDDYFCRNGVYCYDHTLLSDAHQWNQKRAKRYVMRAVSPLIIDNTNLEYWEMSPYIEMATKYHAKYMIIVVEPDTPWRRNSEQLSRRNVHNIPRHKIERMLEKYENNGIGMNGEKGVDGVDSVDGVAQCMTQMSIASNRQATNHRQNNARLPQSSINNGLNWCTQQPLRNNTFQPRFGANVMTRAPSLNNRDVRRDGQRLARNSDQNSYGFSVNNNQNTDQKRDKQFNNNHNINRFLSLSERDD